MLFRCFFLFQIAVNNSKKTVYKNEVQIKIHTSGIWDVNNRSKSNHRSLQKYAFFFSISFFRGSVVFFKKTSHFLSLRPSGIAGTTAVFLVFLSAGIIESDVYTIVI